MVHVGSALAHLLLQHFLLKPNLIKWGGSKEVGELKIKRNVQNFLFIFYGGEKESKENFFGGGWREKKR